MNAIPFPPQTENTQRLDEDLQIVHATLAAIIDDVQSCSGAAGVEIAVAMSHVNAAHHRLVQLRGAAAG